MVETLDTKTTTSADEWALARASALQDRLLILLGAKVEVEVEVEAPEREAFAGPCVVYELSAANAVLLVLPLDTALALSAPGRLARPREEAEPSEGEIECLELGAEGIFGEIRESLGASEASELGPRVHPEGYAFESGSSPSASVRLSFRCEARELASGFLLRRAPNETEKASRDQVQVALCCSDGLRKRLELLRPRISDDAEAALALFEIDLRLGRLEDALSFRRRGVRCLLVLHEATRARVLLLARLGFLDLLPRSCDDSELEEALDRLVSGR